MEAYPERCRQTRVQVRVCYKGSYPTSNTTIQLLKLAVPRKQARRTVEFY